MPPAKFSAPRPVDELAAHMSTHGTKSAPAPSAIGVSTPPSGPGHTRTFFAGSGPRSFWCLPTFSVHRRAPLSARNATTFPDLPAPMTISVGVPAIVCVDTIGDAWKS